jgi:hypothetical protein
MTTRLGRAHLRIQNAQTCVVGTGSDKIREAEQNGG